MLDLTLVVDDLQLESWRLERAVPPDFSCLDQFDNSHDLDLPGHSTI